MVSMVPYVNGVAGQPRQYVAPGQVMYPGYGGCYEFIQKTFQDLDMQALEKRILVLQDKINAKDVTNEEKYILNSILQDYQKDFEKMKHTLAIA